MDVNQIFRRFNGKLGLIQKLQFLNKGLAKVKLEVVEVPGAKNN